MARKKTPLWGEDTDERFVPAATPSQKVREVSGRRRALLVWSVVVTAALSSFMMLAWLLDPARELDRTPSSLAINDSSGKAAAFAAITDWFAATPSPLPGGQIVSWDGYIAIAGGNPDTEGNRAADPAELHHFTVSAPAERRTLFYTVTVLVNVHPELGAKVAAVPTLLPREIAAENGWSSTPWAGYTTMTDNDPMRTAVRSWANAFTSTPEDLRVYLGDTNPAHSYMPLAGAKVTATTITASGVLSADSTKNNPPTLARVELSIIWLEGQEIPTRIAYDVLIEGAQTAAPRVVAWGPVGTGPTLERFSNALNFAIESVPRPKAATAPTTTADPEAESEETEGTDG